MSTALDRGEHGRRATYGYGCRCPACRRAEADAALVDRGLRAVRRGRVPIRKVPTGPVRRHVRKLLDAGWSRSRIARAANVTAPTVARLLVERRCWNVTADAVLRISPS